MPVLTTDLKSLDSKLDKVERRFNKKLESYYNQIENSVLRQTSGYKKNKDFIIPTSKVQGLEGLFRQHFKDVQSIADGHTRRELLNRAKTQEERDKISLLSANKLSKSNLNYAQKLAKKQVQDFEDKIKNKLNDAIKLDPSIKLSEMKKLISDEALGFKNVRIGATSSTESNRITNETRDNFFNQMGIKKLRFTAILDNRTSNFCRSHNNRVFSIDDKPDLPAHINCRSYYLPAEN